MTVSHVTDPGSTTEGTAVIATESLTKRYGGVTAVDSLSLRVQSGTSLGVIGPNGAGKSTLISLLSGALAPTQGRVLMGGQDVSGWGASRRTAIGVGRTHQIPRPFSGMTVTENLLLAARHAQGAHESASASLRRSREILARTGLLEQAEDLAGGLPLLRRKRLELARALALRPRVLLLDEIGGGLVESEIAELIGLINEIRSEVEVLVVVEHVMEVITACTDETVVLDFGKQITLGATADVLRDPQVTAIYLGTAAGGGIDRAVRDRTLRSASKPVLRVQDLRVDYDGVQALRGVDMSVNPGEVVALLGANGAGKSSLARAISGDVPIASGLVQVDGVPTSGMGSHGVARAGIAHCMEGRRIFGTLTVRENLLLAADYLDNTAAAANLTYVCDIFPLLGERLDQPGTAMSGGQQQMLAIARAVMSSPKLTIFDEVSLGLAPVMIDTLYAALARIRDDGMAMVLVEQNLQRALSLADRVLVLTHGQVVLEGTPDEVARDPRLRSLYSGEAGDE